jgi:hypothetical protein
VSYLWRNFNEMPWLLRLLTVQALIMVLFLVGSILPVWSFGIDGRFVTYEEWWRSGAGIFASIVGILFPISGYLLLNKNKYARPVYLGSIIHMFLCQVAVFGLQGQSVLALFMVILIVVCLFSAYLYLSRSVKAFFATTKQFQ